MGDVAQVENSKAVPARRTGLSVQRLGGPVVFAAFLAIYQVLVLSGVSPYFFPPLTQIVSGLGKLFAEQKLLSHIGVTLYETVTAYGIGVAVGLPLGFYLGFRETRAATYEPVIFWIYAVPLFILYPLMVTWFGVGPGSKIAYATLYAFFPVCLNTIAGMRTRNANLERLAISVGATPRQMLWTVRLPAALPGMTTGLRTGLSMSFIGVVATELIVSTQGLGYQLQFQGTLLNLPEVYGLTAVAIAIGTGLQQGLAWLDGRLYRWRTATEGADGSGGAGAGSGGPLSSLSGLRATGWGGPGRTLRRLAVFAGLLALWQAISMSGLVMPRYMPSPIKVLPLVPSLLTETVFLGGARVTLTEFAGSFALVTTVGLVLGLAMGRSRKVYTFLNPVINVFFSFPKMTLLPLFILAFGIDIKQKIAYAFFSGVWVMIIGVSVGVRSVDRALERSAFSMGASPVQMWRTVYIPSIVPLLFVALRSAVVHVFLGVIVSEMAASRYGIGKIMLRASELVDVPRLMSIVVLVTAVTILFNAGMEAYQQRLVRWRQAAE